jgi:hypothetical protein
MLLALELVLPLALQLVLQLAQQMVLQPALPNIPLDLQFIIQSSLLCQGDLFYPRINFNSSFKS